MAPAILGVLIALFAGLIGGSASQRAKRARLDYQRTKALIPAARKLAWAESLRGIRVMAIVIASISALAFVMHTIGRS